MLGEPSFSEKYTQKIILGFAFLIFAVVSMVFLNYVKKIKREEDQERFPGEFYFLNKSLRGETDVFFQKKQNEFVSTGISSFKFFAFFPPLCVRTPNGKVFENLYKDIYGEDTIKRSNSKCERKKSFERKQSLKRSLPPKREKSSRASIKEPVSILKV